MRTVHTHDMAVGCQVGLQKPRRRQTARTWLSDTGAGSEMSVIQKAGVVSSHVGVEGDGRCDEGEGYDAFKGWPW